MSLINDRIVEQINSSNHLLSQKGLAQHLGKAQSTISQWLTQGRAIPSDHIIPICEYLNCSVDWLLTGNNIQKQDLFNNVNEQNLVDRYRQLSAKDKEEIEDLIEFKIERTKKGNDRNVKSSTLTNNLTG